MSADDIAEATRRYQDGASLVAIALELGVAPNTVRTALQRSGVVLRRSRLVTHVTTALCHYVKLL
jgi:hypothetical protein